MHTDTTRWPLELGLACVMALALVAPDAARADPTSIDVIRAIEANDAIKANDAVHLKPPTHATVAAGATALVAAAFSHPVDSDQLADLRGGAQNTHNDMTLAGTTADNSAYQVTTGSNAITSGSFANMSGIPVVIQNTGANVLIQNAVILNLQMN